MHTSATDLEHWTKKQIDAACGRAYGAYEQELKAHYIDYFSRRPTLRCRRHAYSAATLAVALPPGWEHLQRLMPAHAFHRYARSERSSQLLALALLGSCSVEDPSLGWLSRVLDLPTSRRSRETSPFAFEFSLEPTALGEDPRVTTLDYIARINDVTVVAECKWSERGGLGRCSCLRDDGNPDPGNRCASRVEIRHAYWQTAYHDFGLPVARDPRRPCSLSLAYQAVRNVAAARFLSGDKPGLFLLVFDQNNPYFRHTGAWPGWPALLRQTLAVKNTCSRFRFHAVSWQYLIPRLPLPPQVRRWALEKHRLH
jgi:hypothetical protein